MSDQHLISLRRSARVAAGLAGKTYRFLLRMPEELRERLAAAAARNGRSLNSELVHRLEPASSERSAPGPRATWLLRAPRRRLQSGGRLDAPQARAGGWSSSAHPAGARRRHRGRRSASRSARRRRRPCRPAARVRRPSRPAPAGAARQLRAWRRKGPGARPTPSSASARSRPTRSRSRRWTTRAPRSPRRRRRPFAGARGEPGRLDVDRPEQGALSLRADFRNSSQLRAERVRRGRADDVDRAQRGQVHRERLHRSTSRPRAAASGAPTARFAATRTGSTSAARSGSTRPARSRSTRTTRAARRSTSAPARRTSAARGCVAGIGLYKSTNGGNTWTGPIGKPEFQGKGIGEIVVKPGDPNTLYVGDDDRASRHARPCCCTGVTRPVPGAAKWGLYKSTNGGATWSFIHNGAPTAAACTGDADRVRQRRPSARRAACATSRSTRRTRTSSTRPRTRAASGARPTAARRGRRSSRRSTRRSIQTRPAIAVTTAAERRHAHVRARGQQRHPYARALPERRRRDGRAGLHRPDELEHGERPATRRSTSAPAQCWYDLFVYTPKGYPDIVYVGRLVLVRRDRSPNKRGVVLSTDAGVVGTDMTMDATDPIHPNALHPDQHVLVTVPGDAVRVHRGERRRRDALERGVRRRLVLVRHPPRAQPRRASPAASRCSRGCRRRLESMNNGLRTLQFQSLSVSPHDVDMLQGGTQDNGTWENRGPVLWENTMIGDGGQSGFDVAIPEFRFHNFSGASPEVNFDNGDIDEVDLGGRPDLGHAGTQFYSPVISDPVVEQDDVRRHGPTVYRTKTAGLGTRTLRRGAGRSATRGPATSPSPAATGPARRRAADQRGLGRPGRRRPSSRSSGRRPTRRPAWAATTAGRVFVSKNVDAEPASAGHVDADRRRRGHAEPVREQHLRRSREREPRLDLVQRLRRRTRRRRRVTCSRSTFDPATGTSTWVDPRRTTGATCRSPTSSPTRTAISTPASDFGVSRLAAGTTSWTLAGTGDAERRGPGLDDRPGARLYAATHGLGAWQLNLDDHDDDDDDDDDD